MMRPQALGDHLRELQQRGFELGLVGGVFVEGVLVADGFGLLVLSDGAVEPGSRILAASLSGESQAPFAEVSCQELIVEIYQIADAPDAEFLERRLAFFPDAGDYSNVERG